MIYRAKPSVFLPNSTVEKGKGRELRFFAQENFERLPTPTRKKMPDRSSNYVSSTPSEGGGRTYFGT